MTLTPNTPHIVTKSTRCGTLQRGDTVVRPNGTHVNSYNRDGSISPGVIKGHKIILRWPCYEIKDNDGRTRWAFETAPFGFDVAV